jgi:hypothetical protein
MSIFARVESAYDLARMEASRVILVGCGGAASFAEDMMRAGLGEIFLIDPDTVSDANIATQAFYLDEIGEPKVQALARRLHRIRPIQGAGAARVIPLPARAQDLSPAAWSAALGLALPDRAPPTRVLLVGATDDFATQAFVNRLSLASGVPSLCAQVWREGRGAEVTFWAPGADLPCHRCILGDRYAAMAEGAAKTGSRGTVYFAAPRLNALKGQMAAMMLHQGAGHPRWNAFAEAIGRRTLARIRLDPDISASLGVTAFDRAIKGADPEVFVFDETIWTAMPRNTSCPDCGQNAQREAVAP